VIARSILLTNDDGIDAPGLSALEQAMQEHAEIWIVAPDRAWSSMGHGVTTDRPIAWRRLTPRRISVNGTPADCVRLALHHFAKHVDWVAAGINCGANLGADLQHSGTAAAAREAAMLGKNAVAISQYFKPNRPIHWGIAAQRASEVFRRLLERQSEPGCFWNVNLPHTELGEPFPKLIDCEVDSSSLPLKYDIEEGMARYSGDYHGRLRQPLRDVEVCFNGDIAISLIRVYH
jgi:5'/3'-nucleotidase